VLMVSSELDFVNRTRRLSLMPRLGVNSGTYCRGATIPASAAAAPVRAPRRVNLNVCCRWRPADRCGGRAASIALLRTGEPIEVFAGRYSGSVDVTRSADDYRRNARKMGFIRPTPDAHSRYRANVRDAGQ
jgi:hypothetical protein